MKKFQLIAVVLASSMFLSSPVMAFSGDLFPGKGLASSAVQNVTWKFSLDNLMEIVRPGNPNPGRPPHAGRPENPGKGNGRPTNPGNSNPGGGAYAVPEMDAAGGIIAFSLMLSLFGFFREKRRQLSVS